MNRTMVSVVVVCGFMAVATVGWAGKAEIEKQAQETQITLSFKEMPTDKVFGMISMMGGIVIKKTNLPKDLPKVTIDVKNIPVIKAVKLVTDMAGLKYVVTDQGIEVSARKKN